MYCSVVRGKPFRALVKASGITSKGMRTALPRREIARLQRFGFQLGRLNAEGKWFEHLEKRLQKLSQVASPLSMLKAFSTDPEGNEYYILKCNPWHAYFHVKRKQQSARALLLIHRSRLSKREILAALKQGQEEDQKG